MRLLYPTDIFNPKTVDEVYADEYAAASEARLTRVSSKYIQ